MDPQVKPQSLDRQQSETKRENVMHDKQAAEPDNTAVRVALWRALHVEADAPPGYQLVQVGMEQTVVRVCSFPRP